MHPSYLYNNILYLYIIIIVVQFEMTQTIIILIGMKYTHVIYEINVIMDRGIDYGACMSV